MLVFRVLPAASSVKRPHCHGVLLHLGAPARTPFVSAVAGTPANFVCTLATQRPQSTPRKLVQHEMGTAATTCQQVAQTLPAETKAPTPFPHGIAKTKAPTEKPTTAVPTSFMPRRIPTHRCRACLHACPYASLVHAHVHAHVRTHRWRCDRPIPITRELGQPFHIQKWCWAHPLSGATAGHKVPWASLILRC